MPRELYTSSTRLKQAMNGGELPPMTDIPIGITDIIDPTYTIGLGALEDNPDMGLRCPVRGCGVYRHWLTRHIDRAHPAVGSRRLKEILEIPASVPLASKSLRAKWAARPYDAERLAAARRRKASLPPGRIIQHRPETVRGVNGVHREAGIRNLSNRCDAQMRHAMIDMEHQLGRSPSIDEATAIRGAAFTFAVIRLYGSWNAAKALFGLEQYRRGHTQFHRQIDREAVLASLQAYYDRHGCLPSVWQATRQRTTPRVPRRGMVARAMGTDSWPEAMRRAASILNIYGGRYGLPERKAS